MATYYKNTFPSMSYPDVTEGHFYTSYPTFYVTVDSHPHDHGNRVRLAKQPKDEETHFWVAQLILYGLPHHAGIGREEARELIRNSLKVDKDGEMQLTVARNVKEVEGRLGEAVARGWGGAVNWRGQGEASRGGVGGINGTGGTGGIGASGDVSWVSMTTSPPVRAPAKAVPVKPVKTAPSSAKDKGKATSQASEKPKGERLPSPNAGPLLRSKQTARKNAVNKRPPYEITGRWDVSAPKIQGDWREHDQDDLVWFLGFDKRGYLVGHVHLGPFEAYLQSNGPADRNIANGYPVYFLWRGYEIDTGETVFGCDYQGELSFGEDGFACCLRGGPIDGTEFEPNDRSPVGSVDPRSVGLWMGQYNAINETNAIKQAMGDYAESDRWH